MEVAYLFAGIGIIILVGFMGSLFFERTKIPDILILIFIGLLMGPILTQYTSFGLLDDPQMGGAIDTIAPYFAALALVIILFDGGLNLHLEKTIKKMGLALAHTIMVFVGSIVVTALICRYFLGMDLVVGLLLGSIIGGTSGAIVIPLMMKASAREDTKILLTLESVLTDVLCIVTALILIEILEGSSLDSGALVQKLLSSFVLAGFIAFLFGIAWLMVLKKLEGKPFGFMITIAALLLLYAITEFIQVSGAIAALTFGLVLSNKEEIARILKIRGSFVLDDKIKQFHSEVSFLIRTFFFVYLGITFTFTLNGDTFGSLPWFVPAWLAEQPLLILLTALALLFGGLFLVRYVGTTVTCLFNKGSSEDKSYIYTMLPRGLAAAVLAQLPFTIASFSTSPEPTEYYLLMQPYQSIFLNVVFMIIVLSVIVTSIGVSVIERSRASTAPAQEQRQDRDWAAKSPMYRKKVQDRVPADTPAQLSQAKSQGPRPWGGQPAQAPRAAPAQKKDMQAADRRPAASKPQTPTVAQPKAPQQRSVKPARRAQHPLARRAAEAEGNEDAAARKKGSK